MLDICESICTDGAPDPLRKIQDPLPLIIITHNIASGCFCYKERPPNNEGWFEHCGDYRTIGHLIRGYTLIPPQLRVLTKKWEQALYIEMKWIQWPSAYLFFLKHYFLTNYLHINNNER